MAFFTQDQLQAIADALGDTDPGLTGYEIEFLLTSEQNGRSGPSHRADQDLQRFRNPRAET
jgi:hypothetical protein